jgi:mono/diheme cytochrome c family protein
MCHGLTDAHAKPGIGPNFDTQPYNAAEVRVAVRGLSMMPSFEFPRAQIDALARYVASVAGRHSRQR